MDIGALQLVFPTLQVVLIERPEDHMITDFYAVRYDPEHETWTSTGKIPVLQDEKLFKNMTGVLRSRLIDLLECWHVTLYYNAKKAQACLICSRLPQHEHEELVFLYE